MDSLESKIKARVKKDLAAEEDAVPEGAQLTEEEEQDLRIAVMISEQMLEGGGYDVLSQAVETSSDPALVVGQFLTQMVMQLHESWPEELEVSPRIYLSEGGLVEQIGDMLEDEGIDTQIVDDAEVHVLNNLQSIAEGRMKEQQQPPQEGAAPMPAGPPAGPAGLEGAM